MRRQMESMSLAMDGDLQLQWKNRLDSYTDTLRAFKPATAIRLLEQLEESFTTSTNKPNQHFIALLAYQKGICQQFLGEGEKTAHSYLEVYRLDPNNILYKEQAALAHFKLDSIAKSNKMAEDLIEQDLYSTMGWALKLLGSTTEEFSIFLNLIASAPKRKPRVSTSEVITLMSLFHSGSFQHETLFHPINHGLFLRLQTTA